MSNTANLVSDYSEEVCEEIDPRMGRICSE